MNKPDDPSSSLRTHRKKRLHEGAHAMAQTHTRVNKNLKENLKLLCIKGHYQKYKQKNQEKYVNYILEFTIQIYRIFLTTNDKSIKIQAKDINRNFSSGHTNGQQACEELGNILSH